MPECWSQSQPIEKIKTYPWLIVRDRKRGCKTMSEHQNPTNWRNSFVVGFDKCLSRSHRTRLKSSQLCLYNVQTPKLRRAQSNRTYISHSRKQSYGANERSITEITWIQHTEHFCALHIILRSGGARLLTSRSSLTCRRWMEQKRDGYLIQTDVFCAAVTVHIAA